MELNQLIKPQKCGLLQVALPGIFEVQLSEF